MSLSTLLLTAACLASSAQPNSNPDFDAVFGAASFANAPWPVRAGLRIAALRSRVPTVDRVVLVPDEATFVRALREWSIAGRWPILIEDDVYAPLFIRRFRPAEVVRMPAADEDEEFRGGSWRDIVNGVILDCWDAPGESRSADDGDSSADGEGTRAAPTTAEVIESLEALGWTPPGVVITWAGDAARAAALALAADRGQPIAFLDSDYGPVNRALSAERWTALSAEVEAAVRATGLDYAGLGDSIDTLTITGDVAIKYDAAGDDEFSVTDGLARNADGSRWAIAGAIFGPRERTIYQAMCSIFIRPGGATLIDTYPNEGAFGSYAMDEAEATLESLDLSVRHISADADIISMLHGFPFDPQLGEVVFFNTKGRLNWYDLAGGERGFAQDVPPLHTPAAVYFVHSWSAAAPANRDTIAGRWLEMGAFAYVGAVREPYLQGFIPPSEVSNRIRANIPLLIAARMFQTTPWKIAAIGDPLMTFLADPPKDDPAEHPINGGVDLVSDIKTATTERDWPRVIRDLVLLRRDVLALRTWREVLAGHSPEAPGGAIDLVACAEAAFEHVARKGEFTELLDMADILGAKRMNDRRLDLLWARYNTARFTIDDPDVVARLARWIRPPLNYVDAARLAPHVRRLIGDDAADAILDGAAASAKDNYATRLLNDARK